MADEQENVMEKEFSQDDIEIVKSLQSNYAATTARIGQVEIELYLLNDRLKNMQELRTKLFGEYESLQKQEKELVASLNDKYGDGVLDLDSGKFIPSTQ